MLECLKIESSYVYKYVWNFPNVIYTSMQLLIIEINIFKCKNSMKKSTDFWRKVLIFLCLKFFFQMLECLKIESAYVFKYVWNFPNVIYISMQLLVIEINILKCKNSMKKSTDFWRKVLIFLSLKFFSYIHIFTQVVLGISQSWKSCLKYIFLILKNMFKKMFQTWRN